MPHLRAGSLTVTGNFRDNNEDACVVDTALRYFIVADGMGGQAGGEKASGLATEVVPKRLTALIRFDSDPADKVIRAIDQAVGEANAEILALSELDPAYHNMGTTIAFVVVVAGRFYVGGVGDSRVYQLRNGELKQLTVDHSLTQALLDAGTISAEDAVRHRYRNVLYRYLGSKEGGTGTEPQEIEPLPGDRYLLCSDGVSDGISKEDVQKLLAAGTDPQQTAEAIVQAALDGGSKDNVTAVVIFVD